MLKKGNSPVMNECAQSEGYFKYSKNKHESTSKLYL